MFRSTFRTMRVHYLQHVPFEGLGSIEPWLIAAGHEITHTAFFQSRELPAPHEIDLLIAMGGPMSVNEEETFPWLVQEKTFVRVCIDAGKPVLGICLGAQLIAAAMGARVYPNPLAEIGWFPIEGVPPRATDTFTFPSSLDVFHWHGETFDLPEDAVHLAKSEGCKNQAFQLGRSVIGMQFHLETTPDSARKLVEHCREELVPGPFVQSEEAILGTPDGCYAAINRLMADVLAYLLTRVCV